MFSILAHISCFVNILFTKIYIFLGQILPKKSFQNHIIIKICRLHTKNYILFRHFSFEIYTRIFYIIFVLLLTWKGEKKC